MDHLRLEFSALFAFGGLAAPPAICSRIGQVYVSMGELSQEKVRTETIRFSGSPWLNRESVTASLPRSAT
jgi:hypothetical protein